MRCSVCYYLQREETKLHVGTQNDEWKKKNTIIGLNIDANIPTVKYMFVLTTAKWNMVYTVKVLS